MPEVRLDYDNMMYACRACNAVKGAQRVPNPLKVLLSNAVAVLKNGHLVGTSREARRLIDAMQLNRPAYVDRCRLMQRMVNTAQQHDSAVYRDLLGFPVDLPDLSRLNPLANNKPKGVEQSFHARRKCSELPEVI